MSVPLRLIVLARDQKPIVQEAWRRLSDVLARTTGIELVAAEVTEDLSLDGLEADLVVVIGGDGAILRACRQLGPRQLPIMGINLGRLGFLADQTFEEFEAALPRLIDRDYTVEKHLMFQCIHRTAGSDSVDLGLNEVVISSAGSLRLIDIEMTIDDAEVTTYSGDGLIVSTPIGSTAHSLSAGGPILRQNLPAFVITPICPHTLTMRPLVDSADCVFRLRVPKAPEGVRLVIDGQLDRPIAGEDEIEIRRATVSFQMARLAGHNFYATLHRKLGWHGQPRYRDNT